MRSACFVQFARENVSTARTDRRKGRRIRGREREGKVERGRRGERREDKLVEEVFHPSLMRHGRCRCCKLCPISSGCCCMFVYERRSFWSNLCVTFVCVCTGICVKRQVSEWSCTVQRWSMMKCTDWSPFLNAYCIRYRSLHIAGDWLCLGHSHLLQHNWLRLYIHDATLLSLEWQKPSRKTKHLLSSSAVIIHPDVSFPLKQQLNPSFFSFSEAVRWDTTITSSRALPKQSPLIQTHTCQRRSPLEELHAAMERHTCLQLLVTSWLENSNCSWASFVMTLHQRMAAVRCCALSVLSPDGCI